jgi:hypothetical protein
MMLPFPTSLTTKLSLLLSGQTLVTVTSIHLSFFFYLNGWTGSSVLPIMFTQICMRLCCYWPRPTFLLVHPVRSSQVARTSRLSLRQVVRSSSPVTWLGCHVSLACSHVSWLLSRCGRQGRSLAVLVSQAPRPSQARPTPFSWIRCRPRLVRLSLSAESAAIQQCFSLTINQWTVLSVTINQRNEQAACLSQYALVTHASPSRCNFEPLFTFLGAGGVKHVPKWCPHSHYSRSWVWQKFSNRK